ncbi:MAG: glycosyltransferase family 2 protein [Chloroflexi bacterium]|nr:glycosyltransferase family 2 protein [Chloroflexota bacterium]
MRASIIVTSHNYGEFIERCLRSCLSQSLSPSEYEVILVDDASNDQTLEIVETFKSFANFRVIANKENVGVAESANIGIRAALGQYVVRVDADDFVNAHFLLFLSTYLAENHDAFGVACDYVMADESGEKQERRHAEEHPISCGILYRKDLLTKAGLYDARFRHLEEEELRKRLGESYRIHYLRIPLYRYRMHATNKTKRLAEMAPFREELARREAGRKA